jgi:arylsulfatase
MAAREPGRDRTTHRPNFGQFRDILAEQGRLPPRGRTLNATRKVPRHHHPAGPNVLWLMADQLRADTFGFAGHPFIRTPNLDRLAAEGMVFDRSYCSSPVCMPSRATTMTGYYLDRHGVIQNGYPMKEEMVTFPTLVREAGYRTASIAKVHCGRGAGSIWEYHEDVQDAFGATKPSKVAFDPTVYPDITFLGNEVGDDSDGVLYGCYPGPVPTTKSYQIADRAMSWLYWNDDPRPFMLRASFDDPHGPVVPPRPFYQMYDPADIPDEMVQGIAESLAAKPKNIQEYYTYTRHDRHTEDDLRRYAVEYCALVSHLDAQMGRILDYLDEMDWSDNTIVILNADHGNMNGEHGLTHKGGHNYEGVARIPTVVRWPGHVEPGSRSSALVDGVDFMPTVLDMLGIAVPTELPGHSLVPVLEGRATRIRDHAFVQWDDYGFTVVGEQYKLTWWDCDSDAELYDLKADPYEKNNLYHDPAHADTGAALLTVLNTWREQYAHLQPNMATAR